MQEEEVTSGRTRLRTPQLDKRSRLTPVPVDKHATAHEGVRNKGAGGGDLLSDADVTAEDAAQAGVICVRVIRGRARIRVGSREDRRGPGRRPEEAPSGQRGSSFPKSRGKGHVEDEVSEAAAGPGPLNGPRHLTPPVDHKPSVGVGLGEQRGKVLVAHKPLNDGGLGQELGQSTL